MSVSIAATKRAFALKWEDHDDKKHIFPTTKAMPFPRIERENLASKMSFKQIQQTYEVDDGDQELRRKQKWKEVRNFWQVTTTNPKYSHGSLEKCLWSYVDISVDTFVMVVMAEFKFDSTMHFDNHLRWLYWAFEGGRSENARTGKGSTNWRDIVASLKIVNFFRFIRDQPVHLLCLIFDIYSRGTKDTTVKTGNKATKDNDFLARDALQCVRKIFTLPCIVEYEILQVEALLLPVLEELVFASTPADRDYLVMLPGGREIRIYNEEEFFDLVENNETLREIDINGDYSCMATTTTTKSGGRGRGIGVGDRMRGELLVDSSASQFNSMIVKLGAATTQLERGDHPLHPSRGSSNPNSGRIERQGDLNNNNNSDNVNINNNNSSGSGEGNAHIRDKNADESRKGRTKSGEKNSDPQQQVPPDNAHVVGNMRRGSGGNSTGGIESHTHSVKSIGNGAETSERTPSGNVALFPLVALSAKEMQSITLSQQQQRQQQMDSQRSHGSMTDRGAVIVGESRKGTGIAGGSRAYADSSSSSSSSSGNTNAVPEKANTNPRLFGSMENILNSEVAYSLRLRRKHFAAVLSRQSSAPLVALWSKLCWNRLPTDLRLQVLDEAQEKAKQNTEFILIRYKLTQAINMHRKSTLRLFVKEWRFVVLRDAGVRLHIVRRLYLRRKRFFKFWWSYCCFKTIRRRRRILAEVIGNYALKARTFARIKLFIYSMRRITLFVGSMDKDAKRQKLGGTHLREFRRLHQQKLFFHRWWNKCVEMINKEVAERHDFERITGKILRKWHEYAHPIAVHKRMELVAIENQIFIQRQMEEAEEAAKLLVKLEEEKRERERLAEEQRKKDEKARKLEESKRRLQQEKEADEQVILQLQAEERHRRIAKELRKMKKDFKKLWETKSKDMIRRGKERIAAYLENKDNALAIEMKFELLKAAFYEPPTRENVEREKMLKSPKNIAFLFIEAKLKAEDMKLEDLISQFDKDDKGFLTYDQFKQMVRSLRTALNPAQISSMIRGIDTDGDGFLEVEELQAALDETMKMGVPGSPWKMYIDPADDVICYHNFETDEKIFEYKMKDKKLREINIDNYRGEADYQTLQDIKRLRAEEWDTLLKSYYVTRIQRMARRRRARKLRAKRLWKAEKAILRARNRILKKAVLWMERAYYGVTARAIFAKQLHFTYEKVWDYNARRYFWHNHLTKESTWEKPRLLSRYEDVTDPSPWVPVDVDAAAAAASSASKQAKKTAKTVKTGENGKMRQRDDAHTGEEGEINQQQKEEGEEMRETEARNETEKLEDKEQKEVEQEGQEQGYEGQDGTSNRVHYYHVLAGTDIPHKPDGLPLCDHCYRCLAIHRCTECAVNYCFTCHAATHAHPMGFHQKTKVSKARYEAESDFGERLNNFKHQWTLPKPHRCQQCRVAAMLAGIHCDTCQRNFCRPCSRRIHTHHNAAHHVLYEI